MKTTNHDRDEAVLGNLDVDQPETTYMERCNATLRQRCKRFMRKTYAFSGQMDAEAALARKCAYRTFCRTHGTLLVPPTKVTGVTTSPGDLSEFL